MARKKTITRDQILDAAYQVVAKNGFSKFTARNIAMQMNCSTQPIYLEFRNMDDLKQALVAELFEYLATKVYTREVTGNKLIDFGLNHIDFATEDKQLYRALYLSDGVNGTDIQESSYEWFKKLAISDSEYADLSEEKVHSIYIGFWIMTTGMASLMSAGIIDYAREDVIAILEETLEIILSRDEDPKKEKKAKKKSKNK